MSKKNKKHKKDDDNIELWKEYQKDKNNIEIKNKLLEIYYPIVQQISYKVAGKLNWKITPEELSSFGVDGLYDAVEKFDLSRNLKFTTYAHIRIRGSMIDGLRREDTIPRSVRINNNKFEEIRQELQSQKGGIVTDEDIVKKMGINIKEYNRKKKKYVPLTFISIHGNYREEGSSDQYSDIKEDSNENLIDKKSASPDTFLIRKEFLSKIIGKDFTKLEKLVIYKYFYKNCTMDKISRETGISESRISQIFNNILPRIKDKIQRNPKFFEELSNLIKD